jgi:DNA repair exonuclease SbcCD ATPase subunit
MRIVALSLAETAGWPALEFTALSSGLNVICGPARSGKSTVAELAAHSLFGKPPVALPFLGQLLAPTGEVVIDGGAGQYRLRRYQESSGTVRLTVAALDGSGADAGTVQKLAGGLPSRVLSPLCAVSFRESPDIGRLLSPEFARACSFVRRGQAALNSRRLAELAARRDHLAQELEQRIAGDRRMSKELETRWREHDRDVRNEEQQIAAFNERLTSVETALAETDARLRYRRLELNREPQWHLAKADDWQAPLAELDEQIKHWRDVLSQLAHRESKVRAHLAQLQPSRTSSITAIADQRAWLAVARQLAADLAGEVSRLARSSGSNECVCRDAHPRMRPIVETIERQLDVLESLGDEQNRAVHASELRIELDRLAGSQEELRRHVDHLLDRRQALAASAAPIGDDGAGSRMYLSAADAEQLEARRSDLEQQRCELLTALRNHVHLLRHARDEREAIDRERAALLSARSIEHVQRELADVQYRLERGANVHAESDIGGFFADCASAASEYLARLSDGDLVQLILGENGLDACVTDRSGETFPVELLAAAHRDQVYVSLCLALLDSAHRRGIWLPLVLDEPFERLNAKGVAALVAVLDDFCRQGHQVIVFTAQREATQRLSSHGAAVHDILNLRGNRLTHLPTPPGPTSNRPTMARKHKAAKRRKSVERAAKARASRTAAEDKSLDDKNDAA